MLALVTVIDTLRVHATDDRVVAEPHRPEQRNAITAALVADAAATDLVVLGVRLALARHLHETLGERFRPPHLLRDKAARGELGRKSGQGFGSWPRTEGGQSR